MSFEFYIDPGLSRDARRAEMLSAEVEIELARRWRDHRDEAALHRLITAYMRLAISMAMRFRRYGAPMSDLIQEAGLGLMKAADKFDPDRGVRFSTYAVWWIKASIQDFVMRNWSMVRTGSTSSQKSLFFNLKRVRSRLEREAMAEGQVLDNHQLRQRIATEIGVSLADVEMMDGRLTGGDLSLNTPRSSDEEGREWIDTIEDQGSLPADMVAHNHDLDHARTRIAAAMAQLSERERKIIIDRHLREETRTLESLGDELGLSKERIRQVEAAAFRKLREALLADGGDLRELVLG